MYQIVVVAAATTTKIKIDNRMDKIIASTVVTEIDQDDVPDS